MKMSNRILASIAFCVVIVDSTPSPAQAPRTWGAGTTACEAFISYNDKRSQALDWGEGFITALNFWFTYGSEGSVDLMPDNDALEFERQLVAYCRLNPSKTINDGVVEIALKMMEKNAPKQ